MLPARGALVEITGAPSSGRTSLLVAWLGALTREGAATALVDTDETFDPAEAARAGVDLRRLLWVRCGGRRAAALRAADLLVRCPGFALVALDLGERPPILPLAAAFRLRLAARRTGTTLVLLARRRVAGAGACLAVRTVRRAVEWSGPAAGPRRLVGLRTAVQVVRARGGLPAPSGVYRWAA